MKILSKADLESLDKYHRINLINTLSGIKSASLIGTSDTEGMTNLSIFNSTCHIGANPGSLGFIMRPISVERHTYANIKSTNHYTMNIVAQGFYTQAHQTSAKYDKLTSEFDACDLTEEYIHGFKAPFVKEANIKIGLVFIEEHLIYNGTILMVGEIEVIAIEEKGINESGHVDHNILNTAGVSGLDTYYTVKELSRLPFARP